MVYDNVKKALGLDKAHTLMYGAAPLSPAIRKYFLSLNMYLISGYGNNLTFLFKFFKQNTKKLIFQILKGMSECAGPECLSDASNYDKYEGDFFTSTGAGLDGTTLIIA